MLIRDLEIRSGLDRATIRFYEKEGLITPDRKENGYRDYTAQNLDDLLKIKLLRQLGMSLDRIRAIQQGSTQLQTVLEEQIAILDRKIREAENARRVCLQMQSDRATYAHLNVEHYLDCLKMQPAAIPAQTFKESVPRETHPVRRFLARWLIDYPLAQFLFQFILVVILRIRPFPDWISTLIAHIMLFLMVPVEAWMLSRWGTTPGKWSLGIRVDSENGGRLTFRQALRRECDVLRYGYGFGIPVWNIWRLFRSYKECNQRQMDWDWEAEYCYTPITARRKVGICGTAVVTAGLVLISALSLMQPKYHGDLTVAKFASNYNHYLGLLAEEHNFTQKLLPDGGFYERTPNTVSVYLDGTPEKEYYSFDYVLEGEKLQQIRYSNSWSQVFYLEPVGYHCYLASVASVMSQKGTDAADLKAFSEIWDAESDLESGEIQYGDIHIRWIIEADEGILVNEGYYYCADDQSQNAVVRMEFVIEFLK